jgi:hypothetical protein
VKPLCIELFSGTFGWSAGWLSLGGRAIGFDLEHLPHHGPVPDGAELVLQDVLTLDGRQFAGADLILASPPCQRYSYMAMPFSRGKREASWQRWERDSPFSPGFDLNDLFRACFRIQREASAAAGRYIPMVVENVKGAQPWVGRAKARYGSYYLWGDVESIGGRIVRSGAPEFGMAGVKAAGRVQKFNPDGTEHPQGSWFAIADSKERGARVKVEGLPELNGHDDPKRGRDTVNGSWFAVGSNGKSNLSAQKNSGGSWFAEAHNTESGHSQNPVTGEGVKRHGSGAAWFDKALDERRRQSGSKVTGDWFGSYAEQKAAGTISPGRLHGKNSDSRRAASALIARIPYALSLFIARCFCMEAGALRG